jgi:hypothetical protein
MEKTKRAIGMSPLRIECSVFDVEVQTALINPQCTTWTTHFVLGVGRLGFDPPAARRRSHLENVDIRDDSTPWVLRRHMPVNFSKERVAVMTRSLLCCAS